MNDPVGISGFTPPHFQTIPFPAYVVDPDSWTVAWANDAARGLGVVIGQPCCTLCGIKGEKTPAHCAVVRSAQCGQPARLLRSVEGPDKITRVYEFLAAPIVSGSDPKHYLCILFKIDKEQQTTPPSRSSGPRLLQMLDDFAEGLFVLDAEMRFCYFNRSAEILLKRQREEVMGVLFRDAFPEARGSVFEKKYQQAITSQCPVAFETYFEPKRYENWYSVRVHPHDGGIAVFFQVLTQTRKQALALENELSLNAAQARVAAAMLDPAVAMSDIAQIVLDESRRLTLSEHGYVSYIDPQTGDNVSETLTRMMSVCKVDEHNKRATFKKGSDGNYPGLWGHSLNTRKSFFTNTPGVHAHATGIPSGHVPLESFLSVPARIGSQLVGQIALANAPRGYVQEDLEHIESLAHLYALALQQRNALDALSESEDRYRTLFDSMAQGVVYYDVNGLVTFANPAAERILGLTLAQMLGRSPIDPRWRLVLDDGTDLVPEEHPGMIALRSGSEVHDAIVGVFIPQKETFGWFVVDAFPEFRQGETRPYRVHLTMTDITEKREQAWRERRDAQDRLVLEEQLRQSQKLESLGRLAGGIAHDFNNILGGILGLADMMLPHLEGNPKLQRYAQQILMSTERGARVVKQMLLFARKSAMENAPFDVDRSIEQIRTLLEHTIDRRISLVVVRGEGRKMVLGDRAQLENALLNICFNARDAMPQGGRITFETQMVELDAQDCIGKPHWYRPGCFVKILVIDNGVGMEQNVLERIFEPFYTTKEAGRGTGLGLASVYGCIKQHDGIIDVVSAPGEGTTFMLFLPLSPLEENAATVGAAQPGQSEGTGVEGKTVVVVEDDDTMAEIAEDMLLDAGANVVVLRDGQAAVEWHGQHVGEADVFVVDLIMPRMNGYDCCCALWDRQPDCRIILASGYSVDAQAQKLLSQGARAFISKPYRKQELLDAIRVTLEKNDGN